MFLAVVGIVSAAVLDLEVAKNMKHLNHASEIGFFNRQSDTTELSPTPSSAGNFERPSPSNSVEAPSPDAEFSPEPSEVPDAGLSLSPTPTDPSSSISPSQSVPSETELDPSASNDSDDAVCFPADARVTLSSGATVRIDEVNINDRVQVSDGSFSPVFMFTHRMTTIPWTYVKIDTASGSSIRLTKGHYLYVNDRLASAETVGQGDYLKLSNGLPTLVTNVSNVKGYGLINPQTAHGDIVVDGIVASTYTTAIDARSAHALLAPLRAVHDFFGLSMTCFDRGANHVMSLLPKGSCLL